MPTADLAAYVAPSEAQTVTTQELEEVQQSFNDVENKSNRRIYVGAQVESLLNRDKKSGKRNPPAFQQTITITGAAQFGGLTTAIGGITTASNITLTASGALSLTNFFFGFIKENVLC